ncbi:hypothetical protein LCGC14_1371240 [marine sediment metagenome]|uniref:Uncharacterized protein n=1 Tax=marine sediment metagenome TaxID=412755 RepID=A0A0F9KRB8_9ZZZZ
MQDKLTALKKAYGLENLRFYEKNNRFRCTYVTDADKIVDGFGLSYMDYILKALSAQQCCIFFDDVNKMCVGMDELKQEYLIFRLAGL